MHRLLELAHITTVTREIYIGTIVEHGKSLASAQFPSFYAGVILSAFIDFTAQAVFCFRVRRFSRKWIVASVCFSAAFVRLVLIVMVAVMGAVRLTDIVIFQTQWGRLITSMLILGAGTDVLIALAMCYYLRQHRASQFARQAFL